MKKKKKKENGKIVCCALTLKSLDNTSHISWLLSPDIKSHADITHQSWSVNFPGIISCVTAGVALEALLFSALDLANCARDMSAKLYGNYSVFQDMELKPINKHISSHKSFLNG